MKRALITAVFLAGTAASSALAAPPRRVVVFSDGDRQVVRTYYTERYRDHDGCPPGLIRTGDACLTRGQLRRQYVVGRPLARNIVIAPVPGDLLPRQSPAPYGYSYGVVDGDVVRYNTKTRLIVDAINALIH
jgi:hypothetical protein